MILGHVLDLLKSGFIWKALFDSNVFFFPIAGHMIRDIQHSSLLAHLAHPVSLISASSSLHLGSFKMCYHSFLLSERNRIKSF